MFADNDAVVVLLTAPLGVLFGVVILFVVGCLPATGKPLRRSFGRLFFMVFGWVFIAFGCIVLLQGFTILVLFVAALVFVRWRRARQQALLWTMAVAAERSIPLIPAIEAFAEERSGSARQETEVLSRLLKGGTPLPEALSIVGGMVPEEALAPIYVGQELGDLGAGLRQATGPAGPEQAVWDQLAGNIAYLCWILLFSPAIVIFMMLKIAPAFHKIFQDFNLELPPISRIGMGLSEGFLALIGYGSVFLLFLMIYMVLRYVGAIAWDLPLMTRATRKMHAARVLESLAMAAERNRPLLKTVATLARCYPKRWIRRRLAVVLVDIASGIDFVDSMRRWRLVSRADAAVLHAAARVGNLAWAMREIADSNRRRLAYRVQMWLQILFPAVVVCLGLAVLFFWATYFFPLIALIQKMA